MPILLCKGVWASLCLCCACCVCVQTYHCTLACGLSGVWGCQVFKACGRTIHKACKGIGLHSCIAQLCLYSHLFPGQETTRHPQGELLRPLHDRSHMGLSNWGGALPVATECTCQAHLSNLRLPPQTLSWQHHIVSAKDRGGYPA